VKRRLTSQAYIQGTVVQKRTCLNIISGSFRNPVPVDSTIVKKTVLKSQPNSKLETFPRSFQILWMHYSKASDFGYYKVNLKRIKYG
jgi:hypothetical protein